MNDAPDALTTNKSPESQNASTLPAPAGVVPVTKVCTCCWRHISPEQWRELPYVGLMEDGNGGYLELRNHECGSTLSCEAVAA